LKIETARHPLLMAVGLSLSWRLLLARLSEAGPARYIALWLVLLLASALIVVPPEVPIAGPNPLLAAAVALLAAAVGLALLQLGLLRFFALGDSTDLLVGFAFGTLAMANLFVRVLSPVVGLEPSRLEVGLSLLLFNRMVAGLLFLAGLVHSPPVPRHRRRRAVLLLGTSILGTFTLVGAAVVIASPTLPQAVTSATAAHIDNGSVVVDLLPGQEPWLIAINAAISAAMVVATAGYAKLARKRRDRHLDSVAVALSLLTVAQFHTFLFPPISVDYVSSASAFRFAAYLVLLYSLVAHIGGDISKRVTDEERLRLSRELHDGLAQHLGLLGLRLSRAREPGRSVDLLARDLDVATGLVEVATLEARQAIVALRGGPMTWDELHYAVTSFAEEFSRNHDVTVQVHVVQTQPVRALESTLRIEVLRILHEACSNAVRHGSATQIDVGLAEESGVLCLSIIDDGDGFDRAREATFVGIGLRSMRERAERRGGTLSLDSAPGKGVTILVRLPLIPMRDVG
jgi:signal transduction histidine kinase